MPDLDASGLLGIPAAAGCFAIWPAAAHAAARHARALSITGPHLKRVNDFYLYYIYNMK
jgi:hypothetical protein